MSTASKQSSKKETKKEIKKEPISDTEMENSDMENDKHSIFNGDFKKNPTEAKNFLKHFNAIKEEFYDSDSEAKVLKFAWGESYEALTELVKKNNKKEKAKKTKFVPSNLESPKKAIDIFGKLFSEESKAKGVKFSKDNNYLVSRKTAWDALSKKEQDKYINQAEKEQEAYDVEFAKQKAEAVKNGEFPEEKIKGPCTAYFLYLADIRPKLTEKFKNESDKNTKITKEGGKMWKALSDKEKEKYMEIYKKNKAEYDIKNQEWKTNEVARLKKQDGNGNSSVPDDVKIESSGKKKAEKVQVVPESDNTDSEEVEVKSKKTKSKTSTKKEKVAKVEKVEEVEEEASDVTDEVEEVKVEKPKAKVSKTKAK